MYKFSILTAIANLSENRHNLRPDFTKHERVRGAKKQKLRINVFLTCNVDGSEKLHPMVMSILITNTTSEHGFWVDCGMDI